jgi:TetR/AcrR family transcriptional regulator, regulator of cefoperazone and chloramphenicol sensitivity
VNDRPSTRARIRETAEQLFAERGLRRVTVRDISRAAGVNVAAVNYHFGDKLGLYQEVVQVAIDAMRGTTETARRAGEGLPPEERLRVFVATLVGRLLAGGPRTVHRLVQREMGDPTPALERIVEEGVRPRLQYLAGLVAEILGCPPSDGRVRRCVSSIQAQALAVVPNAIGARLGFAPAPADAEAIAEHITAFSLGGLRGLAGRTRKRGKRGRRASVPRRRGGSRARTPTK